MRALVIPVDEGPTFVVDLPGTPDGNLAELQRIVGGWVERVEHPSRPGVAAFVNSDGKNIGKAHNRRASALLFPRGEDWIAGECVLVGEVGSQIAPVPRDLEIPA